MKKFTAVTLSLCFALGAVACSDKNETSDTEDTTIASESETVAEETTEESRETRAQMETVPQTSETVDTSYIQPYVQAVKKEAKEQEGVTFNLIHIDDDDIPELVVSNEGYWVSVYTMVDGELKKPIDHWSYGAMGNSGYMYEPYENVISNFDSDYAGAIRYETLMALDDSGEVETLQVGTIQFYKDEADAFDQENLLSEPLLFINNKPVSAQEYYAVFNDRPQERYISGSMSEEEVTEYLLNAQIPQEHTYEIFTEDVTWTEAAELAREKGGYLATLQDPVEFYVIFGLFKDYNMVSQIFIVGGSQVHSNAYVWTEDGSNDLIDGELWRYGEPSYEGRTEGNESVKEDKVVMLNGEYMDVPDDILGAAPSYSGSISYIVEYDHRT